MFTFFRQRRIWSFHVVVLQRTVQKCTKNYNARAQPLFCSLNLLFSNVPVAVAVVDFLNSLNTTKLRYRDLCGAVSYIDEEIEKKKKRKKSSGRHLYLQCSQQFYPVGEVKYTSGKCSDDFLTHTINSNPIVYYSFVNNTSL